MERQGVWLSKDDLKDTSSWSSPPLLLLRDICSKLLTQYDCKEVCEASQSQVGGVSARQNSQNDIPQQQVAPLSLPQVNRLFEVSLVRDESSSSTADVPVIPTQNKVTDQILSHWQPFIDLQLSYVGSRRTEQLSLRSQQRIVATEHLREVT